MDAYRGVQFYSRTCQEEKRMNANGSPIDRVPRAVTSWALLEFKLRVDDNGDPIARHCCIKSKNGVDPVMPV